MDTGAIATLTFSGLFMSLVAWFIVGRLRAWKIRKQKLSEWAKRNGMSFSEGPVSASAFAPLPTLRIQGDVTSCEASNVARGTRADMPVVVFDLARGVRHHNNGRTTYRTRQGTFALFERPDRRLPYFEFAALSSAGPSSFQGKSLRFAMGLAHALHVDKAENLLQLEGRPGFLLRGNDSAAVHAVFTPSVLDFFDHNLGWTVEAERSHILVGLNPRLGSGWKPPLLDELVAHQDFDRYLPLAAAIAQRF
jgi:hypothetical protein